MVEESTTFLCGTLPALQMHWHRLDEDICELMALQLSSDSLSEVHVFGLSVSTCEAFLGYDGGG